MGPRCPSVCVWTFCGQVYPDVAVNMEVSAVGSYFHLTPAWPNFYVEIINQLTTQNGQRIQQILDSAVKEVRRASRAATSLFIIINFQIFLMD